MKKFIAILLSVTLSVSMIACSSPEPKETETTENISTENSAENETVYPVTITDQAGREVVISQEPQKIVSGYYISTSLLIALGKADSLVGIEAKADKRPIYALSAPELIELPNVGTAKEFDLEGCAALEPDLAILPLKLKDAAATLSDLGIPTILVNPESGELLEEMIHIVSAATNTASEAEALQAFSAARTEQLADLTKDAPEPSVYLAGNSNLLSTAGANMYQHTMIENAGGANAAGEISDSYWVEISYEQLLNWNPDYIILASDASYTCDDVLNDPNLASCKAVADGNVYQLPYDAESWDSPVPSGILGSVWLCSIIHPTLMTSDESTQIINEYYETFYNFQYPQK